MLRNTVLLQSLSGAPEAPIWLVNLRRNPGFVPLLFTVDDCLHIPSQLWHRSHLSSVFTPACPSRVEGEYRARSIDSNRPTGFAWGLKGFYIAGPGALTGAGLSFLSLRFLFKRRLAQLQQANTHWRALDQVVVRAQITWEIARVSLRMHPTGCKGSPPHHSHSVLTNPALGVLDSPICFYYFCQVLAVHGR